jgi:ketosteroid isomerase-like protein
MWVRAISPSAGHQNADSLHMKRAFSAVEVIRCLYDAHESDDVRVPAGYFRRDAESHISEHVPWGGRRKGSDQLKEGFSLLRRYVATAFEPSELIDCGNQVVAIGTTTGIVNATGRAFAVRTVHVWHFEDGKIVRFDNYLDRALADVLNRAEPAA